MPKKNQAMAETELSGIQKQIEDLDLFVKQGQDETNPPKWWETQENRIAALEARMSTNQGYVEELLKILNGKNGQQEQSAGDQVHTPNNSKNREKNPVLVTVVKDKSKFTYKTDEPGISKNKPDACLALKNNSRFENQMGKNSQTKPIMLGLEAENRGPGGSFSSSGKQRVEVATMYLTGKVEIWFGGYIMQKHHVTWHEFKADLCHIFSDRSFSDIVEEFTKLTQKGSVEDYQENRLRDDIKHRVKALDPNNLFEARATLLKMSTGDSDILGHIILLTMTGHPTSIPMEVQHVLDKYSTIFAKPEGLPPQRSHDHAIPLKPNATSVNLRPYRFPHNQKVEIGRSSSVFGYGVTVLVPTWVQEIEEIYQGDSLAQNWISILTINPSADSKWKYSKSGHSGAQATYYRIRSNFYWPNLKPMVATYVRCCEVFQQTKALYGYKPPIMVWPTDTTLQSVSEIMQSREHMRQLVKQQLELTSNRMNQQADKSISERVFTIGDLVYLKLQPYMQSSITLRKKLKLAAKYYGPYKIMEKVGEVAYRLDLPVSSRHHPVFHVSLLKKFIGDSSRAAADPPEIEDDGQFRIKPLKVIGRQIININGKPITQLLVRWQNLDEANDTWEDYSLEKKGKIEERSRIRMNRNWEWRRNEEQDKIANLEMKLMDIDNQHLGIPDAEYQAIVRMPSTEFVRICKDLSSLGDTGVKFFTAGDIGTANIVLRQNTTVDKATPLSNTISISLSSELPVVVEYKIVEMGYIMFYLAPKIEDEVDG
ncbi:Proliferating cell nuclear antigen [Hibiscus syriacus]|uniref:Proliferating cell nuclear antigen n=1 Tax=Hibiscus syriacus TaxID=106335 RepID=A0A6A2ZXH6_HIBSY|nr:Proliferating cell nuclear antigen [Hibiscus syriacus]